MRCAATGAPVHAERRLRGHHTAQRAEDVVNSNAGFHGPADYVVARDEEVLQAGYYVKSDGCWNFESTAVLQ